MYLLGKLCCSNLVFQFTLDRLSMVALLIQDAQTLHEAAKGGDIEATRRLLNEVWTTLCVLFVTVH